MPDRLSVTEALIASGHVMRIVPQGTSMRPLLDGKRDSVVVSPLRLPPKKFSLVLYRDDQDVLVVHRVMEVDEDRKTCVLLGDGNIQKERGIPFGRISGVVTRICRNGREFSPRHPVYLIYVYLWRIFYRYRARLLRRVSGKGGKVMTNYEKPKISAVAKMENEQVFAKKSGNNSNNGRWGDGNPNSNNGGDGLGTWQGERGPGQ